MHTYTVPRPAEFNTSYFPSVLVDSNPQTIIDNQFYEASTPQWNTTPYGLLTPPQFNISFPTNNYLQSPHQIQQPLPTQQIQRQQFHPQQQQQHYQQYQQSFELPLQYQSVPQFNQQSPTQQQRQEPSPFYSPTGYYTPRSSVVSLPSPTPTTQGRSSIHYQVEQPSNDTTTHVSQWFPSMSVEPPLLDSNYNNQIKKSIAAIEAVSFELPTDKTCTPFVSKLSYLLENFALFGDVIRWDPTGTSFLVTPSEKFITEVLPNIFSHCSLPAFTRQLNTYGFNRINRAQLINIFRPPLHSATPIKQHSAWYHPLLTRANPSTMTLLAPKQSKNKNYNEIIRKRKEDSLPIMNSFISNDNNSSSLSRDGFSSFSAAEGSDGMRKKRRVSLDR